MNIDTAGAGFGSNSELEVGEMVGGLTPCRDDSPTKCTRLSSSVDAGKDDTAGSVEGFRKASGESEVVARG
ncbi:hypothetical protein BGW80DRAFT_1343596 [Lactifluus volemus]|nr:hypothetical protein BGW80DRAFT_1343596 [Lactifluus volemus]